MKFTFVVFFLFIYFHLIIIFIFSQKTIIDSIVQTEDESLEGKAYYSMAIIYGFFSIFNWAAPSVISVVGPKVSMIFGGITYL